jgi:hypothetical protein
LSSQFLVSGTSGEPSVRHKYEVTPSMVGQPLDFTVSYREAGVTIDLFLFSTHANLMEFYSQTDLDGIFINNEWPKIGTSLAASKIVVNWPTSTAGFVLESTGD